MIKSQFFCLPILLCAIASSAQIPDDCDIRNTGGGCTTQEYKCYFPNLLRSSGLESLLDYRKKGKKEEVEFWRQHPEKLGNRCSQILPIEGGSTVGAMKSTDANNKCGTQAKQYLSTIELRKKGSDGGTSVPASAAVGRLELQVSGTNPSADGNYLRGTGFVVGQKTVFNPKKRKDETFALVATTCHAIESLSQKGGDGTWQLKQLPSNEKFLVGYGDRSEYTDQEDKDQVESLGLEAYSRTPGLDVAFLKVLESCGEKPCRTAMQFMPFEHPNKDPLDKDIVVIGYPDFHHPFDPEIGESYGPFTTYGTAKFLSTGKIEMIGQCESDSKRLLHTASTTMGESGGPLILKDRISEKDPVAVGVHICCSAYWSNETGDPPYPKEGMDCARTPRQFSNKAVSSNDILEDPHLCSALKDYGAFDGDCPRTGAPSKRN